MRARAVLAALVVFAAAVPAAPASAAACAGADEEPTAQTLERARTATLCLLNVERRARGMRKLRENKRLRVAAKRHSADMNQRSYFDHVSPGGSDMLDRVKATGYLSSAGVWSVGENIAWGTLNLSTPRSIVREWMHSPPHKANILKRRFRDIGIGISLGTPDGSGDGGATYTTNFGARG